MLLLPLVLRGIWFRAMNAIRSQPSSTQHNGAHTHTHTLTREPHKLLSPSCSGMRVCMSAYVTCISSSRQIQSYCSYETASTPIWCDQVETQPKFLISARSSPSRGSVDSQPLACKRTQRFCAFFALFTIVACSAQPNIASMECHFKSSTARVQFASMR